MTNRIWGGFHGKGGSSRQLFSSYTRDPSLIECWSPSRRVGNPCFKEQENVSMDEVQIAHQFMILEQPSQLIAYSRGGSIYTQMMAQYPTVPKHFVIFVAAAWKRFWDSDRPHVPDRDWEGIIIHGDLDGRVPLKWSVELSQATGLPLVILRGVDHIGTIFDAPFHDRLRNLGVTAPHNLDIDGLPDWGQRMEFNSDDWKTVVGQQQAWVDLYWRPIQPDIKI